MSVMTWSLEGRVATLTMNNGENRHNPDFNRAMLTALDEIEANPDVRALRLASSDPKSWSLGIDLNWIMAAATDPARQREVVAFLYDLNKVFARLLTYPVPVIAVLNGHAFGDGAIMACACDFRFMRADRGYFCFPEVDLNIPFMPGMDAIVKKALPRALFDLMSLTGQRMGARDLAPHGVLRACPDAETLDAESMAFASHFDKQRAIVREMKTRANRDILRVLAEDDPPIFDKLQLVV